MGAALLVGLALPGWSESIFSAHDVSLGQESVSSISAGGDVRLNGTRVMGSVSAGHEVSADQCSITGHVSGGHDVSLRDCPEIQGAVTGGHHVELVGSTTRGNVSAGHHLVLRGSTVQGNATAGGEFVVESSRVDGTLSTVSPRLVLDNATVRDIVVTMPHHNTISSHGNRIIVGNGGIVMNGNGHSRVVMQGGDGHSRITVGPGSVSTVNGYTVRATVDQTTLITPDNTIYVNGKRVSGHGAESYHHHRHQFPQAPSISGPGWQDLGSANAQDRRAPDLPGQVVELTNHSVVTGNIHFEGGHGQVIVHPGTRFEGAVTGGRVTTR